jgi:hypothetical protein
VPGRVDEVERVGLSVAGRVPERDGAGLDRDPALLLELHVVQHLLAHVPVGDGAAELQNPVGQGGLAMVDVGNDREVADELRIRHENR